jgi:uncharacterized protein (TIGR00369 family)
VSDPAGTDVEELIRQLIGGSPFAQRVGMRLASLGDDTAEVELPFAEGNVTVGDVVHGGAVAALVDVAAVAATWTGVDLEDPPPGGATLSASINYLSAARGERLQASARVTKRGHSICFSEVEVSGEDGRPVALGLVAYRFAGRD